MHYTQLAFQLVLTHASLSLGAAHPPKFNGIIACFGFWLTRVESERREIKPGATVFAPRRASSERKINLQPRLCSNAPSQRGIVIRCKDVCRGIQLREKLCARGGGSKTRSSGFELWSSVSSLASYAQKTCEPHFAVIANFRESHKVVFLPLNWRRSFLQHVSH